MPLIHVIARQLGISKSAQYANAADPKQHSLAKPVVRIPAIKAARQRSIGILIIWKVGIQKVHRHFEATHALDVVSPGPQLYSPVLQRYANPHRLFMKEVLHSPDRGLLRLRAVLR